MVLIHFITDGIMIEGEPTHDIVERGAPGAVCLCACNSVECVCVCGSCGCPGSPGNDGQPGQA